MEPRWEDRYTDTLRMPIPVENHAACVDFAPVARREVTVFGAPAELVLVPQRRERHGRPMAEPPAFVASRAARIVRDEAIWRENGLVLTPNRYPFAAQHRLLWPDEPIREVSFAMWHAVLDWTARSGGTALVNNIGAAATIARAHAHLVPLRLPFLTSLPERPLAAELIELPRGVELLQKDTPVCLVGVRGDADACAKALLLLAEARRTAACNVVVHERTAWLFPRSLETPTPHFPYALGAAEVWGRWCYMDEEPFRAADGDQLERALVAAGKSALR